jgi:beta-phosphoglucomutase-like phosphatase (HAD superfamily)
MADPLAFAPRRFRFVVFDWDGTLADSTAIIALALQQSTRGT